MQKLIGCLLLIVTVLLGGLSAQDQSVTPPPKVLMVIRENLKPGKAGSPHQKTESAFPSAFAAAKWPQRYLGMDSLSGAPRSLFLVGYDSFAAWEKDTQATQKNAALSAALDRAAIADGEMLSGYESSAFVYNEEQSFHSPVNIAQMRYFEIDRFHVRPGHDKDWEAITKIYKDGYEKAVPDAHWAVYQEAFGQGGNVYLVFVPMKSLSEVDKGFGDSKKFFETIGEDGMKRLADLIAAATDDAQANLFQFNPHESYVSDQWIKSDPTFWKSKTAAPAAKAEPKPAQ